MPASITTRSPRYRRSKHGALFKSSGVRYYRQRACVVLEITQNFSGPHESERGKRDKGLGGFVWPCMADLVAGYWVSLVLALLEREQYRGNGLLSIYNVSFFFLILCGLFSRIHVWVPVHAWCLWRPNRVSDPLGLELQMMVSCPVDAGS